jgi:hypothetical protein
LAHLAESSRLSLSLTTLCLVANLVATKCSGTIAIRIDYACVYVCVFWRQLNDRTTVLLTICAQSLHYTLIAVLITAHQRTAVLNTILITVLIITHSITVLITVLITASQCCIHSLIGIRSLLVILLIIAALHPSMFYQPPHRPHTHARRTLRTYCIQVEVGQRTEAVDLYHDLITDHHDLITASSFIIIMISLQHHHCTHHCTYSSLYLLITHSTIIIRVRSSIGRASCRERV